MTEFDKYLSILKKAALTLSEEFTWFFMDKCGIYACTEKPYKFDLDYQLWLTSNGEYKPIYSDYLPDIKYEESIVAILPIMKSITNCKTKTKPKTSTELLQRAIDLQAERGKQYDKESSQERSMASIIQAFNAITGRELTESEGWLLMVLLKAKRAFTNTKEPHRDSFEDLISYASLLGECALTGEKDVS